jgi:aspartate carbamoyltransferase catalytic subunit
MIKNHLISILDLKTQELENLIEKAAFGKLPYKNYSQKRAPAALIFLEDSTRTRMSFERACQVVGRPYSIFDTHASSLNKGESLRETFETLHDYGYRYFVVRIKEEGQLKSLCDFEDSHILCAGEGKLHHPTQVLGDAAAILKKISKKKIKDLKKINLAIVGDIKHSRVAHSWYLLANKLGVKLHLVSPSDWRPSWGSELPHYDNIKKALKECEFVMSLRVQNERHSAGADKNEFQNYIERFQLKKEDLASKHLYLHPGPTNWGVEMAHELAASGPKNMISLQRKMAFQVRCWLLA